MPDMSNNSQGIYILMQVGTDVLTKILPKLRQELRPISDHCLKDIAIHILRIFPPFRLSSWLQQLQLPSVHGTKSF